MIPPAIFLLALVGYGECRGEGAACIRAVQHVAVNRSHDPRFAGDLMHVLYQPRAFSCLRAGANREAMRQVAQLRPGVDYDAWQVAKRWAVRVARGRDRDPTRGGLYYHLAGRRLIWDHQLRRTARIGGHDFYREQKL